MKRNNGEAAEEHFSRLFHSKDEPLLISSLLLRRLGAGQVDLAIIKKKKIYLIEIKDGGMITQGQIKRLKRSARLVQGWTQLECYLYCLKKVLPKRYSFFNLLE